MVHLRYKEGRCIYTYLEVLLLVLDDILRVAVPPLLYLLLLDDILFVGGTDD
jgi:hypothetical protein